MATFVRVTLSSPVVVRPSRTPPAGRRTVSHPRRLSFAVKSTSYSSGDFTLRARIGTLNADWDPTKNERTSDETEFGTDGNSQDEAGTTPQPAQAAATLYLATCDVPRAGDGIPTGAPVLLKEHNLKVATIPFATEELAYERIASVGGGGGAVRYLGSFANGATKRVCVLCYPGGSRTLMTLASWPTLARNAAAIPGARWLELGRAALGMRTEASLYTRSLVRQAIFALASLHAAGVQHGRIDAACIGLSHTNVADYGKLQVELLHLDGAVIAEIDVGASLDDRTAALPPTLRANDARELGLSLLAAVFAAFDPAGDDGAAAKSAEAVRRLAEGPFAPTVLGGWRRPSADAPAPWDELRSYIENEARWERPAALLEADDSKLWTQIGGLLHGEPDVRNLL
ncbi:hypothetical protein NFJ02_04g114280 [Pycnococcus provasolii]